MDFRYLLLVTLHDCVIIGLKRIIAKGRVQIAYSRGHGISASPLVRSCEQCCLHALTPIRSK